MKDEGVKKTNLLEIFTYAKPHWKSLMVGLVACIIGGLIYPAYSIIFMQVISVRFKLVFCSIFSIHLHSFVLFRVCVTAFMLFFFSKCLLFLPFFQKIKSIKTNQTKTVRKTRMRNELYSICFYLKKR